jgi:hypothetical protein
MSKEARKYTLPTIKKLYGLSNLICYNPDCNKKLMSSFDEDILIGKISHIEAASPKGPRYRADMTDDERKHFINLILLCDECHTVIDNKANEGKYPVELLREWKRNHEADRLNQISKNTSLLGKVIKAIADADFDEADTGKKESLVSFGVDQKIKFNSLIENRYIIETYSGFTSKINAIYGELERDGSFRKENLLKIVNLFYLKVKGKYVKSPGDLQANADKIFEGVEEMLMKIVESERNNYQEEIFYGVAIVMTDAFIRCKILEEPPVL